MRHKSIDLRNLAERMTRGEGFTTIIAPPIHSTTDCFAHIILTTTYFLAPYIINNLSETKGFRDAKQ